MSRTLFVAAMFALIAGCSQETAQKPLMMADMPTTAPSPESDTPAPHKHFRVFCLSVTSNAQDHVKMIAAAEPMLTMMATDNNFSIDITRDGNLCNDANLAHYDVFLQLQEAPFDMAPAWQAAMQKFVTEGHGWVGIHGAGIVSKEWSPSGVPYWQWYEDFLGGVLYSPHPAYQKATLVIDDRNSPITKGLPATMQVSDEWYEFSHSPRLNPDVHVLAHVDESTYHQNKPMGDHPMIWTNTKFGHMVYISIGHDAYLCSDPNYQRLVRNSILWAAE